jgi:hypothetical protein
MTLPKRPQKSLRPMPVTIRISKEAAEYLRMLGEAHNISQGEVVDHLIKQEYGIYRRKNKLT